tara:strand:+ start:1216 stop:1455 length:240 start_codon:yes stop_codon:yes gene_type:complete
MKEEKNPLLETAVASDSPLKQLIVNHVGETLNPEDDDVTVEMVVEVFSKEFPEFVFLLAEENFIRGYEQALTDVESTTI